MDTCSQKSTFATNVLKMASAPLVTQLLGITLMPIVTRLYAPDVYGAYTLFGSILMPITIFATMGYSASIVLPKDNEVASNMLSVSLGFTILLTLMTIPFIWIGMESLLRWLKAPELYRYMWVLPAGVLTYGFQTSLLSWNVRYQRFGRISISKISFAAVNKAVLIGAGFLGFATTGSILIGGIVSSIAMSGILGGKIWKESGQLFKQGIRWRNMIQGIKRYRKFPMYNLWTELVGRFAELVTVFLLSYYYSKSVIGYYGLGIAVLKIPTTFIGSSITEVFYQKAAVSDREGARASLVEKLFKQMTWMTMLFFMLLAVIGDKAFAFVFGIKWLEAGIYSQILSFNIFVNFIINPALVLANIIEKQEISLLLCITTAVVSSVSFTIGGWLDNIYIGLGLFSLFNGLALFGTGLLMIHFVGVRISRIFGILFKCFVSCTPVIAVVAFAKWYSGTSSYNIIIISAICCIIYYAILLKKDKGLQEIIITMLRKIASLGKKQKVQG